jgi:tripartite-type tricarboxylate transporter receptor subunit TctC
VPAETVHYRGGAPMMADLITGRVDFGWPTLSTSRAYLADKKLRALALDADARWAPLPDVPTLDELGFKDQEADTFQGVLVPAGTPQPIVDLLHKEIVAIVALPDVKDRFAQLGLEIIANTPDEFTAQIKREIEKWGRVIRDANIKAE